MMLSKFSRVVPTCTMTGLVHGLSWTGLATPTTPWLCATVSILLAILDTRRWGMSQLTVKLWDGDRYAFYKYGNDLRKAGRYRVGIRAGFLLSGFTVRLPALQSFRCLTGDARLWWLTLGESEIPEASWADFRALIIERYGPLPGKEVNMPYRDPEIYNDMYLRRYLSYVADWYTYPNESMGVITALFADS
ncbi:hypothetical protein TIFTF001_017414 [Ficus carica]|uniref:Uncharacterized protein n=1 Tax=Ficus carica TaxID=3494 RepID=A0AA88D882_FICCA|nr:hypothetical protein TIFTF001_017414 [Ficus carica]